MQTELNMDTKHEGKVLDSSSYTNYRDEVAKLSGQLQHLSNGELAELRRISPEEPFTPTLWRLLLSRDLDKAPHWIDQVEWEKRWATLLMGMAHCAPYLDMNRSLGAALFEAGWSELRLDKLLRARDEQLNFLIRRVAHYLANKSQPANWADVARLLFFQGGKTSEEVRIGISRAYYRAEYHKEN